MRRILPWLALLFCSILGGSSYPITRYIVGYISPVDLAALTFIPASIVAVIMLATIFRKSVRTVVAPRWWLWLILAVVSLFGFQLNMNIVSEVLPSSVVALIVSTWPVLTLLLGAIFLRERATPLKITGSFIALAGAAILIVAGAESEAARYDITSAQWIRYSILTLMCPLTAAAVTVASRHFLTKGFGKDGPPHPVLYAVSMRLPTGFLILFLFRPHTLVESFPEFPNLALAVTLIVLLASARTFGFWLWNWALQRVEASSAAIFTYFQFVFALIIARSFLGEPLTFVTILAAGTIVVGVVVANWNAWRGEEVRPIEA